MTANVFKLFFDVGELSLLLLRVTQPVASAELFIFQTTFENKCLILNVLHHCFGIFESSEKPRLTLLIVNYLPISVD
jgi:hypothetical protein